MADILLFVRIPDSFDREEFLRRVALCLAAVFEQVDFEDGLSHCVLVAMCLAAVDQYHRVGIKEDQLAQVADFFVVGEFDLEPNARGRQFGKVHMRELVLYRRWNHHFLGGLKVLARHVGEILGRSEIVFEVPEEFAGNEEVRAIEPALEARFDFQLADIEMLENLKAVLILSGLEMRGLRAMR